MWALYLTLICILLALVPKIRIAVENHSVKSAINKLKSQGYYVLEKVSIGGVDISYLLLSKHGIHLVKVCKFPKRNILLTGSELERIWYYYVAYLANPIIPARKHTDGPPANAERHGINNPVIELEKAINMLKANVALEGKELSFYPIVVFIPKIKAVKIDRKATSKASIIFTKQLANTISENNIEVFSNDEIAEIYNTVTKI